MTGIFVARAPAGKPRCARCHRPFTPKHESDKYGPKCARKAAASQEYAVRILTSDPAVMV